MKEKFSDFESVGFISKPGTFTFEVKSYELKDSKAGNPMAVFVVESKLEGQSTLYFPLAEKARWKYNNFIKACLHNELDTPEKIAKFEWDYAVDGKRLIGKKFIGTVVAEKYDKEVKKPLDDGTFDTVIETTDVYHIDKFASLDDEDGPAPF